ncbi:hypothetical protein LOC68_00120 [Blastopirellula sp. JC732]|uniref:Uncharacterized protein n=1 Tax=Blastopirellula sediminis TaxID=2894196 RepID=A0A9X1MGW5_9BACT|nr:hypothetical protein [Blastopirellula sediminis]MCC9604278.1 hypothetical protein [Blastopirellula sediminis]MCC9626798.1 hypothetical protein [Blastopirellula sediminis]
MPYDLKPLYLNPPSHRLIVPYANPHYPVVFIARWPKGVFASHGEFIRFYEAYDSAMQGYLQGMPEEALEDWFVPHESLDFSQPAVEVLPERTEDAVVWMERNFPFVQLPWLKPGDHSEILDEDQGKFGSLTAYGNGGYLYVFVADEL